MRFSRKNSRRHPGKRRCLTGILFATLSICACEKKNNAADQTKAKPDDPNAGKSDDDFQVVESIPMGLMPLGYEDELSQSLVHASAGAAGYSDFGTNVKDLGHGKVKNPLGKDGLDLSLSIAETPARVSAELAGLTNGTIKVVFDQIFGASGAFKNANFDVKKGKDGVVHRHVHFTKPIALGAATYEYAALRAKQPGDTEAFTVELWGAAAEGKFARYAWIGFTPAKTAGDGTVSFHIAVPVGDGKEKQVIDGRYDTASGVINAAFGKDPLIETEPAVTSVIYDIGAAGRPSSIAGAYSWYRVSPLPSGLLPRYYSLGAGDVEAFRSVTSEDGDATSVDLAFVPAELNSKAVDVTPSNLFAQYGYPQLIQSFVLKMIRNPGFFPDCATGGDEFRAAFTAGSAPASVQSAPANICAANTAFTDAQVLTMLKATCAVKAEINLPVQYASGATSTLGLCSKLREGNILANTVRIAVAFGQRQVTEETTDDAAHKLLAPVLAALAPPAIKDLHNSSIAASAAQDETVDAAEFSDAVYLP